jgi:hypothetical protein
MCPPPVKGFAHDLVSRTYLQPVIYRGAFGTRRGLRPHQSKSIVVVIATGMHTAANSRANTTTLREFRWGPLLELVQSSGCLDAWANVRDASPLSKLVCVKFSGMDGCPAELGHQTEA